MKVFFAVDGSPASYAAIRQVGQFLAPTDVAAIYFAPPEVVVRQTTVANQFQDEAISSIVGRVLDDAIRYLPDPQAAQATTITTKHAPREGILKAAHDWGADLIVVGARGLSALDQVILGGVSRSVAQQADRPVLVARPHAEHRTDRTFRVLVAFDGSPSSGAALTAAQRLTYPQGTEIIALTVVDAPPNELPAWIHTRRSAATDAMIEQWRHETERDKLNAQTRLRELLRMAKKPFSDAETLVGEGHAAEQILKIVNARDVDLVVIGSGGKGALQRALIGSTSDKVLLHAPCSVLIARSL